jgi:hypothetical protein
VGDENMFVMPLEYDIDWERIMGGQPMKR